MKHTYKKLFNITYNSKVFTIFLAENNRKTFLELKNNKYFYPLLEDFLYLNNFYNNINPFIEASPSFYFDEKVRFKAGLLAVVIAANLMLPLTGCKARVKEEQNELVIEATLEAEKIESLETEEKAPKETIIYIEDLKELDEILDYTSVTPEEVINAIDNNTSMPADMKALAKEVLNEILAAVPDIDLRIFYENMKSLNYQELPIEMLQNEHGSVEGVFNFLTRTISTHPDASTLVKKHELYHTIYSFHIEKDGIKYYRTAKIGRFVTESKTENSVSKEGKGAYQEERAFLKYLESLVPITNNDYYQYSVNRFISSLKSKYPTVAIDYIFSLIDTRMHSKLDKDIILEEIPTEILDELFNICKINSTKSENVYAPFSDFADLILSKWDTDLVFSYLEKYNTYLKEQGISNLININDFQNIYNIYSQMSNFLVTENNEPIPIIMPMVSLLDEEYLNISYTYIDEFAKEAISNINTRFYYLIFIDSKILLKSMLTNYDIIGTTEFWQKLNEDNKIVSPSLYTKTPIYYGNELIATEYFNDLKVTIGEDLNGDITFQLKKGDQIIFGPSYELQNNSARRLTDYVASLGWLERLDLESVFNLTYLKGIYNLFDNLVLKDEEVQVKTIYNIMLDLDDTIITSPIYNCYFYNTIGYEKGNKDNYVFHFGDGFFLITLDSEYNHPRIDLETVLSYYNLLDERKDYLFTLPEIEELINRYVSELDEKLER